MRCTTFTILLIAASLSACQKESAPPKPPNTTAAPGSAAAQKFDFLIDWQAEPTYLGIYYAKALGAFSELGLDVNIVQSWGANDAASAIAAGKYKIGTASGAATVIANSSGADLVSMAVIYHRLPTAVFGLRESGISKPKDLEGRNVGIYAKSITKNEFEAFAKLNQVAIDKVNVVAISGPDLPYLLTKKVDAVLNYFELSPTQLAMEKNTFQLLLDEHGVKSYGLNVITSRKELQKDPKLITGITKAVLRGYQEGCSNQEKAIGVFHGMFPEKDVKYVRTSWAKVCAFIAGDFGSQSVEGWQTTLDLYKGLGLLNGYVDAKNILPPQ